MPATSTPTRAASKQQTALPTAQVLIVDDEPEHAEVMAEALKRMGHVCTIVTDRWAAEEELTHGTFDLVVTDLVMETEHDGQEVLKAARRSQADAEVVMVTAHGDVPHRQGRHPRGGVRLHREAPRPRRVPHPLRARAAGGVPAFAEPPAPGTRGRTVRLRGHPGQQPRHPRVDIKDAAGRT